MGGPKLGGRERVDMWQLQVDFKMRGRGVILIRGVVPPSYPHEKTRTKFIKYVYKPVSRGMEEARITFGMTTKFSLQNKKWFCYLKISSTLTYTHSVQISKAFSSQIRKCSPFLKFICTVQISSTKQKQQKHFPVLFRGRS